MHKISLLRTSRMDAEEQIKVGHPSLSRAVQGCMPGTPWLTWAIQKASATSEYTISAQENHLRALNVWKNQTRFRPRDTRGKLLFKLGRTARSSSLQAIHGEEGETEMPNRQPKG